MKNYYTWIESYLNGELSSEEHSEFESALEQNADLAEELARHRVLLHQLGAMRTRLKVADALLNPPPPSGLGRLAPWLLSLFLLLGIGGTGWYFMTNKPNSNPIPSPTPPEKEHPTPPVNPPSESLPAAEKKPAPAAKNYMALAQSFQREPMTGFTRSNDSPDAPTRLDSAMMAYEKGNYAQTLTFLPRNTPNDTDETELFLRGNAHMKTGQWQRATADFSALVNSFQFRHEARFNLALCQLATQKTSTAVQTLKKMAADPVYPHRQAAADLLRQITTDQ